MTDKFYSPETRIKNVIKNFFGRLFKDKILDIIYKERRDIEEAHKIAEAINKFVNRVHSYFKNSAIQIIENLPEEKQKKYKEIEFKIYQILSEIGEQVVKFKINIKPLRRELDTNEESIANEDGEEYEEELEEIISKEEFENIRNLTQKSARRYLYIIKKNKKNFKKLYFLYSEAEKLFYEDERLYFGYSLTDFKFIFDIISFFYFINLYSYISPFDFIMLHFSFLDRRRNIENMGDILYEKFMELFERYQITDIINSYLNEVERLVNEYFREANEEYRKSLNR